MIGNKNFVEHITETAMKLNESPRTRERIDALIKDNCSADEVEKFEFEEFVWTLSRACANILLFGDDYKRFLYVAKEFVNDAYKDVENSVYKEVH